MLLMVLQNRPEKFLPSEELEPVVDYHIQRMSLRTGLVIVNDSSLQEKLLRRVFVSEEEEAIIRKTVYVI